MREQRHQRLPFICFAWKINRLYQVLELQKAGIAETSKCKKKKPGDTHSPRDKMQPGRGSLPWRVGRLIWGRGVSVAVVVPCPQRGRGDRPPKLFRANQPCVPCPASSLCCPSPYPAWSRCWRLAGDSRKAWPPNPAVSKGRWMAWGWACGRRSGKGVKSAFLRPRPPPCLSFLSCKGEVGPGLQRGKFWGAWKVFSSSHSFWQQGGLWRWIFVSLS